MLFTALLCLALADARPSYAKPDLLVEPAEMKDSTGRFVLLDVRPLEKYAAGHASGAVWADLDAWDKLVKADTGAKAWSARLGKLGIDGKKPVVVYGDSKSREAARAWWILRQQGVPDVRLVNGDWAGYKKAGGPVEENSKEKLGRVEVALKPAKDRLATKAEILAGLKAGKPDQLIDARTTGEYCGDKKSAKRGGSIPGAKHLDWADTIDPKTGRFKPAGEMKKLFEDAGIALDRPTATYCQSGGRAAVMAFVFELMTGKPAKNYYRSWAEWGNDPDTPVVTPKAKKE